MECSLCCEPFAEEGAHVPRNLECGHTFCTVCIERLDNHASVRQGARCPECRLPIRFNRRPASSLPKNYKLLELIREQSGETAASQSARRRKPPSRETSHSHSHGCYAGSSSHEMCSPVMETLPSAAEYGPHRRPTEMMFMGNCYLPNIGDWMSFGPYVQRPVQLASLREELSQLRISSSVTEEESRNRTPSTFPPLASFEAPTPAADPEAVENGRAVTGPSGALICKFFPGGTCRYGHRCWFSHPVHNENKTMCRHWLKGQCRMGLECNFRHGTQRCPPPIRHSRQRPVQDPSEPGPSGEGSVEQPRQPSVVVFVSSCGSTVHHQESQTLNALRPRGNLPTHSEAAGRSLNSEHEEFFDDFSAAYQL